MENKIIRYKLKVYGRVQGVFYRQSAQQKAEELDLRGFVRNDSDGKVYIEVEGSEEDLKKFITWSRKGSQYAEVKKVEVSEKLEAKVYDKFIIED